MATPVLRMDGPLIGLAIGGARCVWDDLKAVENMSDVAYQDWPGLVGACNDVGITLLRLDHWCSLHWDKLDEWRAARRVHFPKQPSPPMWTREIPKGCKADARITDHWGGSSGLLTVKVLLEQGCDRVICVGIPINEQPHFNKPHAWDMPEQYPKDWERHYDKLKDRVRSASGWTRELLGGPEEWLT